MKNANVAACGRNALAFLAETARDTSVDLKRMAALRVTSSQCCVVDADSGPTRDGDEKWESHLGQAVLVKIDDVRKSR